MTAGLGYLLHNLGQHAALDLDAIPFSQFAAP